MKAKYVPERGHIIWLDFEPKKGKEIGKYRPALILSSKAYNQQTGLLICCPVSTSIRGASIEVPIDNLEQPSVVVCGLVHTLDWQRRKAKYITKAKAGVLQSVLQRIIPLIGGESFFK